jgi:hypothetical protein
MTKSSNRTVRCVSLTGILLQIVDFAPVNARVVRFTALKEVN